MTLPDEKSTIAEHDRRTSDLEKADTDISQKQAYIANDDGEYNVTFRTWIVVIVSRIKPHSKDIQNHPSQSDDRKRSWHGPTESRFGKS